MTNFGNAPVVEVVVSCEVCGKGQDPREYECPTLSVDHDPLDVDTDRNAKVIIWRAGENVREITDVSFKGSPDPRGQITRPVGAGTVWVCVDRCTRIGEWEYSISATCADGNGAILDPMIRNQ